jgi:hypothetical protein
MKMALHSVEGHFSMSYLVTFEIEKDAVVGEMDDFDFQLMLEDRFHGHPFDLTADIVRSKKSDWALGTYTLKAVLDRSWPGCNIATVLLVR